MRPTSVDLTGAAGRTETRRRPCARRGSGKPESGWHDADHGVRQSADLQARSHDEGIGAEFQPLAVAQHYHRLARREIVAALERSAQPCPNTEDIEQLGRHRDGGQQPRRSARHLEGDVIGPVGADLLKAGEFGPDVKELGFGP